jgi:DNA-binding protein Fis
MELPKLSDTRVLNILDGLKVVKSLYVSTIIIGEKYSGRYSLVRANFPNTITVSGKDLKTLKEILLREEEIIVTEFETINDPLSLNFDSKRVIAVADSSVDRRVIDDKFAFIYHLPPLKERMGDVDILIEYFLKKAKEDFMIEEELKVSRERVDISKNIRSLKASVYKEVLLASLDSMDIEDALYGYFKVALKGYNAYRENLGILEKPLLKAGLEKFGSQLKLSEILGINRNTLRKKLHEYRID